MSALDNALLHRKGKATWEFVPDPRYGKLIHVTRCGNIYAIIPGLECGKPFWIALRCPQGDKFVWCTVEADIRAESIEFGNGGRYIFPKR
jgi:hypothetical protein